MAFSLTAAEIASYAGTAAAVAGSAYGIANGQKQGALAKKAQAAQLAALKPPPKLQESVAAGGSRDANAAAALAGIPGTLLTGAKGVDPNSLNVGKTLLGG